ncbi:MAG: hypothetical protein J7545_18010 [Roseofilum sp. SBFL]|nr:MULTISPECIES: hypothetical protein [unclassified Roseofilum]MBP0012585.1 hypothetical protein [Roseofilum sp. SID3]MBP0023443.1 hypothetical protein [Roseofilum sp. SID2]MBP0038337.1 hypothetical protein [Roseofilum sp. SID1]MBP0043843.1 hypothetical protein [Roseofilum sp. SBFL]
MMNYCILLESWHNWAGQGKMVAVDYTLACGVRGRKGRATLPVAQGLAS